MKFADIPHFILKAYIDRSNELAMEIGDAKENTLRTINPDFIYQDSNGVEWKDTVINGNTEFTWSGIQHDTWQVNSYIMGPRTSIVTNSGEILHLYYKDEMGSFQPIRMISDGKSFNFETEKQHDFFNINHIQNYNRESELLYDIEEEHHSFKIYDLWNNELTIPNGSEIYFRKDSLFHQWVRNYGPERLKDKHKIDFLVRNYINIDKPYIYLGTLYKNNAYTKPFISKTDDPVQDFFNYIHKRAMFPENAYYLLYYNIKNFVIDCIPEHQRTEKFKEFLYYNFDIIYNEVYSTQKDIPNAIDPLECDYEFLWDLCKYYNFDLDEIKIEDESVKRNFVRLLPFLLKKRGTYSSVYAIWKILTGNNPNRFNIYERWHEVPLTYTQYGQNYVVQEKDYMDWLHTSFYGVTDYESGAGEEYYGEYFNDELYPKLGADLSFEGNKIIHNMNDIDLIVELYNSDGIRILPENLSVRYTYLAVTPFEGTVVVRKGDNTIEDDIDIDNHIVNLYKDGNKILWNKERSFDADRIVTTPYDYKTSIPDTTLKHKITHNLGQKFVISAVYDTEGIPILPKVTKIVDSNTLELEFYEPVEGEVLVCTNDYQFDLGYEVTLSTQYRVEPDITDYPVEEEKILSKEMCDSLYTTWEHLRPSNRTPAYKVLLAPKSDLTGEPVNNYSDEFIPYLKTHTNFPVEAVAGTFINYISGKLVENVYHRLASKNLIIELFDDQFNRVFDEINQIEIIDNDNIRVELDEAINYYILIKRSSYSFENDIREGQYKHSMDSNELISQFFGDDKVVYPRNFTLIDNNYVETTTDDFDKITLIYPDTKIEHTSNSIWEITHDFKSEWLFVETYDHEHNKVIPNSVQILDENNIRIEFDTNISGYVLIKKIGEYVNSPYSQTFYFEEVIAEEYTINHNLESENLLIYFYDENFESISPDLLTIQDENSVNVKFSEEIKFFVTIKIAPYVETTESDILLRHFYKDDIKVYPEYPSDFSQYTVVKEEPNAIFTFDTASDVWEINHNMSLFGFIVDVYDTDNNKIKPSKIELIDYNNIRIEFNEPTKGRALITFRSTFSALQSGSDVTYTHNLGTKDLLITLYDQNYQEIIPDKIELLDDNTLNITNEGSINFFVYIKRSSYIEPEYEELDIISQYYDYDVIIPLNEKISSYEKIVKIEPTYIYEKEDVSDTWEINHNLSCFGVVVDIYNDINEKITPNKIKLVDSDNVIIYFDEPVSGKALFSPFFTRNLENQDNSLVYISDEETEHIITHNFDTDKIVMRVYDDGFNEIKPKSIEIIDNNSFKVDTNESMNIFVLVYGIPNQSWEYVRNYSWIISTPISTSNIICETYKDDKLAYTNKIWKYSDDIIVVDSNDVDKIVMYDAEFNTNVVSPASEWELEHNFNGLAVIGDFYDSDGWRMPINNIHLKDVNSYKVDFNDSYSGISSTTYIGDMSFLKMRQLLDNCYFCISNTKDKFQTNRIDLDVKYVKETDNWFYININVPNGINTNILEMGVLSEYEGQEEIIFYTDCSDLFKYDKFDMNLFYKIEKKFRIIT